ncbi:hypothetical protein Tco_1403943 [Tanacetum coccineum]
MISPKQTWKPKGNYLDSVNRGNGSYTLKQFEYVTPLGFKGGYVAFGNDSKGGRISGKGTIKTSCLDFEKVAMGKILFFTSKTQHIQIRISHSRLLMSKGTLIVVKGHTDDNVADLLTKGFDLARFNFLVVTIGMMNL